MELVSPDGQLFNTSNYDCVGTYGIALNSNCSKGGNEMIGKLLSIGFLLVAAGATTTGTGAVLGLSMGGFILYLTCTALTLRLLANAR